MPPGEGGGGDAAIVIDRIRQNFAAIARQYSDRRSSAIKSADLSLSNP